MHAPHRQLRGRHKQAGTSAKGAGVWRFQAQFACFLAEAPCSVLLLAIKKH